MGAEEYLPKPITDEELFAPVERALTSGSSRPMVQGEKHPRQPHSYGIIENRLPPQHLAQNEKAAHPRPPCTFWGKAHRQELVALRSLQRKRASAPLIRSTAAHPGKALKAS
jgi:DNA-binding response OmpR family regulator